MKLYSGKIRALSGEIVKDLIAKEAIEVDGDEKREEVRLDVVSVLKEYLRMEREINQEARDLMQRRGMDYSAFGRVKRKLAKGKNFGIGEEAIGWMIDQLIEVLLHTNHVEEVWAEDHDLRRIIAPVLRKHMEMDDDLDIEVRKKIKNLSEGSVSWDIRYQQVLEDMKRRKGFE